MTFLVQLDQKHDQTKAIRKLIRIGSDSDVDSPTNEEEETDTSSMILNVEHSEEKMESEENSADSFEQTESKFSLFSE